MRPIAMDEVRMEPGNHYAVTAASSIMYLCEGFLIKFCTNDRSIFYI